MKFFSECVNFITFPFQSKVDNIGMYHAIAKDIDEYNGGSDLMRNMAQYLEGGLKKFCVSWSVCIANMEVQQWTKKLQCSNKKHVLPNLLQKLISSYYEEFTYEQLIEEL